jgi:uncharacterized protein
MKFIFLILLLAVIYIIFFKKKKAKDIDKKNIPSNNLIECSKCHTFVPENEITYINNKPICKDCYANS